MELSNIIILGQGVLAQCVYLQIKLQSTGDELSQEEIIWHEEHKDFPLNKISKRHVQTF